MAQQWLQLVVLAIVLLAFCGEFVDGEEKTILVKHVKGKKLCMQGWECPWYSEYCCNQTISDLFQTYQFENLFSKRNSPLAHAVGFWDYRSFITAAALFQPLGFGTTGGKWMQMKEIAAFLGHVGSKTSCGYGVATGGPLAWGLCYNKEESPMQSYCDESDEYKLLFPCAPGADYYGRGSLPIYWNFNYGYTGEALKLDLIHHPEWVSQNATIAWMTGMHKWMTPIKKGQPSPHDCFVGNWKPTKNDTAANRVPGFGCTMNILDGSAFCGQRESEGRERTISHYLYYLDLMGVGREMGGSSEVLDCAEQEPFNPIKSSTT